MVRLEADRLKFFAEYDQLKYGGLLCEWIDKVPPVVLKCKACGHSWYRYQPDSEQLARMYDIGRPLLAKSLCSRDPSLAMYKEMLRLRRLVGTYTATPSLLDYGSGRGRWARAAIQAGFKVHAFEPSETRGSEEDAPFTLVHELDSLHGRLFEVVNIEQVLEHVPDPFQTLKQIRCFCHPKTIIRIAVPNILRCHEGKKIWRDWPFDGTRVHTMAPFEHLHGFTPLSLVILVKRANYKPLSFATILRQYPLLTIRNVIGRIYSPAGQTMILVTPATY